MRLEVQSAQQFSRLHPNLFTLHPVDTCKETDIFRHGQIFIEREFL